MVLPEKIEYILGTLVRAGFPAYVVGGCVRDSLAGREPHDWDVCTAARPEQVRAAFAGQTVLDTGLQHGTVTLLLDHEPFEITTFRVESGYSDSRHPDRVEFTDDVRLDLARRDFTVNAMAYAPEEGLVDPFGGQADLTAGLIRCVGTPEDRFAEDALRILRALRFAARFGFALEPATAAALRVLAPTLGRIAPERIRAELDGLLTGQDAGSVLRAFPEVIAVPIPEITPCVGFPQRNPWHIYDVWEHTLCALDAAPADPVLRWSVFFHDLGKPSAFSLDENGVGHFYGHAKISAAMAEDIMSRLRFSNERRDEILVLVSHHDDHIQPQKKSVRRLLGKLGQEQFRRLIAVLRADKMAQTPALALPQLPELDILESMADEILRADECVDLSRLAVSGRDLIDLGYSPGPALGAELQQLLNWVLDDPARNEKNTLLRRAEEDRNDAAGIS